MVFINIHFSLDKVCPHFWYKTVANNKMHVLHMLHECKIRVIGNGGGNSWSPLQANFKCKRCNIFFLLRFIQHQLPCLVKGGSSVAYIAKSVAVTFIDIVGFTPLTASLNPPQLVQLLSSYFQLLETYGNAHGVHKIKTIGDGWFGCSKSLLFGGEAVSTSQPLPCLHTPRSMIGTSIPNQHTIRTLKF